MFFVDHNPEDGELLGHGHLVMISQRNQTAQTDKMGRRTSGYFLEGFRFQKLDLPQRLLVINDSVYNNNLVKTNKLIQQIQTGLGADFKFQIS